MSKFNSDAESLVIDEEAQDDAPLRKAMVTKENNSDSDTNEEIDVVTLDDSQTISNALRDVEQPNILQTPLSIPSDTRRKYDEYRNPVGTMKSDESDQESEEVFKDNTGDTSTTDGTSEDETDSEDPKEDADEDIVGLGKGEGGVQEHTGQKRSNNEDEEGDISDDEQDYRLEDDDFDLLEENLGVKVKRRQFKRVKLVIDSDSDDGLEKPDERQPKRPESIMDSDAESNQDSISDDDFIVDEEGRPIDQRVTAPSIICDEKVQTAREIFGIEFDYDDIAPPGSETDENSYDSEEDQSEDERIEARRRKKVEVTNITKIFEPAVLEEAGITAEAKLIRETDVPERYQVRPSPIVKTGSELNGEVVWIYQKAFASRRLDSGVGENTATDLPNISFPASTIAPLDEDWDEDDGTSVVTNVQAPVTKMNSRNRILTKIKKVIKLIRDDNYEVPYIYFYKKDLTRPDFTLYDLWKIYELDEEYCKLYQRKSQLLGLVNEMQSYQESLDEETMENDDIRPISEDDINHISSVQDLLEFSDFQRQFLLYYWDEIPKMKAMRAQKAKEIRDLNANIDERDDRDENQNAIRASSSGGTYKLCRRNGVGKLLPLIGLCAEEFGENMEANFMLNYVHQCELSLDEVFKNFTTPCWSDPSIIGDAAIFMLATQFARDVKVRKVVREVFHAKAKICVVPTKLGLSEIDENHPLFPMKFLKDKPAYMMDGIDFIELTVGEKDRLVSLTVGDYISGRNGDGISLIEEAKQLFKSDEDTPVTKEWEAFRGKIIDHAFEKILYPELRKEVRSKLLEKGKVLIKQRCSDKIYTYLKDAPYKIQYDKDDSEGNWNTSDGIRVMGVTYDEMSVIYCVIVDKDGSVMQSTTSPSVLKRSFRDVQENLSAKDAELVKLTKLVEETKPHVVIIGGECRTALNLLDEMKDVFFSFEFDLNFHLVPIHIIENDVAKVYSRTSRALEEFPGTVEHFRQAVSLARLLQEPLLEIAQLFTPNQDILSLHFYKYQRHLSDGELLRAIEIEFINRTSETGVDINQALKYPHKSNSLQFVPGLGHHKAKGLLAKLRVEERIIKNRAELINNCGMGAVVYRNCAGFIKIVQNDLAEDADSDPRDGTRIHPEYYHYALTVAQSAVDGEENLDCDNLDDIELLQRVMKDPQYQVHLRELSLDEYVEDLRRTGFGDLKLLFTDIITEFENPYGELRKPFYIPTRDDLFYILSKETCETVREGKLLTAYVFDGKWFPLTAEERYSAMPVWNNKFGKWACRFCEQSDFTEEDDVWNHIDYNCKGTLQALRIRFGNGITGTIKLQNFSDYMLTNTELLNLINLRLPVQVRVININREKFFLECTSKSSDILNSHYMPTKDPYYDDEVAVEKSSLKGVKGGTNGLMRRNIGHPSFKNITYLEAEDILKQMEQGDVLFRPSTKGCGQLSLSWNVVPGIIQHVTIIEKKKRDVYSLGASLMIGEREYEDLDEIIVRFVNPQSALAREVLDFNYKTEDYDDPEDASEYLKQEREKEPGKVHYVITASRKTPAQFILSCMPEDEVHQEFLTLYPEGIGIRSECFSSMVECVEYWKKIYPTLGKAQA